MEFKVGTRGRIVSDCFVSSDVEETDNGILTANEHWREEGEFVVVGVEEDFIKVVFDGEDWEWWIGEEDFENLETL